MYERILVPLDGSELAEGAIPYAEAIATKSGGEVLLFTVCTPGDCLERPLRAYLDKKRDQFSSSGVRASSLVATGDVATEILDSAERNAVSLIIISTHGYSGVSRWALGNVANKVLRSSRIPTLLVRASEGATAPVMENLRTILVPLDGSIFAEAIVPYAETLALSMDSNVVLLRIVEPVKLPRLDSYGHWLDLEKYEKDLQAEAESKARLYLSEKEIALRQTGVRVSSIYLLGYPAQTILEYAEAQPAGLTALSTHGFSGVTRWAYGSVASRIVEGSSRPVLVVRPPMPPLEA
jgi:nucleotide-binding universal stress UspA family protein